MLGFDIAGICIAGVGLISVLIAVVTFVTNTARKGEEADAAKVYADPEIMNYFASKKLRSWDYLWGFRKTCPQRIPAIQKIVELGEDVLYTSEVFDQLLLRPSKEAPWVSLYSAIFDEMARGPPLLQEYNAEKRYQVKNGTALSLNADPLIQNFRIEAEKIMGTPEKSLFEEGHLVRCVRRLDAWNSEFVSTNTAKAVHVPTPDAERGNEPLPCVISGKPCIKVSREELCGLALLLGIRFRWDQRSSVFRGEGAFGLDMSVSYGPMDYHWRLSLNQVPRRPRHKPSKGSGYTPLFAIYMGCGIIPFTRDSEGWIKGVYVSPYVLSAIRKGSCIIDKDSGSSLPGAIEYLRRLPTSMFAQAWPHFGSMCTGECAGECAGQIKSKNEGEDPVGTWWQTVSGIAFGGLVPQATEELKNAVIFTVTGLGSVADEERRLDPNDPTEISCTEALERLENAIHKQATALSIFGEYVRDRGNWSDATYAIKCENTNDAAAVFGRYMTLLERLAALYKKTTKHPHERRDCIFDETQKLLEKSYRKAIAIENQPHHDQPNLETLSLKLGKVIKNFEKTFTDNLSSRKAGTVSVQDCAWVAACIITAWAMNVQIIRLVPRKIGNIGLVRARIEGGKDPNTKDIYYQNFSGSFELAEEVSLEDLPHVMAFG